MESTGSPLKSTRREVFGLWFWALFESTFCGVIAWYVFANWLHLIAVADKVGVHRWYVIGQLLTLCLGGVVAVCWRLRRRIDRGLPGAVLGANLLLLDVNNPSIESAANLFWLCSITAWFLFLADAWNLKNQAAKKRRG